MKTMKKLLSVIIALALAVTLVSVTGQAAKKKPMLCIVKANILVGKTLQMRFINLKKGKKVIWSSSKKSVATVSKKGMVTAKKVGKAKITAKVGKKKYTCTVTVNEKNKNDVAVLKKIIAEQKKKGATVNENLDSLDYSWNGNGRLVRIGWLAKKLSGEISFAGLTALEDLNCYHNQLTGLDVTKNIKLKRFGCGYNLLGSLDVTNNVALEYLYCCYNKLTSLDVTKNVALKYLDCSGNQLTSLDITKNVALEKLYCGRNKLTSLDVSNNSRLGKLSCDNDVTVIR